MSKKRLSQEEIDFYHYVHVEKRGDREPRWRGCHLVKFPEDLVLYAQVIFKRNPKYIIETGTKYGGSALFFGDMLTLSGGKKVFSVDITDEHKPPKHAMVEHVIGSSIDESTLGYLRAEINKDPGSVMVVLDSDHSESYVKKELEAYKDIVTPGQYMVVEDCWTRRPEPYHPYHAANYFLQNNKNFKRYNIEKQFKFAVTKDGWLYRVR